MFWNYNSWKNRVIRENHSGEGASHTAGQRNHFYTL